MIVTSLNLDPYVGQRIVLSDMRVGNRRWLSNRVGRARSGGRIGTVSMNDGPSGTLDFDGPIFVLRRVTREQYVAEKEQDAGRAMTRGELVSIYQSQLKFFEISVD